MEKLLRAGFAALGLPLDETALARFQTYYTLLDERSKVMNLTAIHGETDVAQLHFLDSAALLTVEPLAGKSVIDVGTGAGFPGLPLKIAQPDISLTLLDSLDKRVRFLGDVCAATGLADVTCLHARAEEAPEPLHWNLQNHRPVAEMSLPQASSPPKQSRERKPQSDKSTVFSLNFAARNYTENLPHSSFQWLY